MGVFGAFFLSRLQLRGLDHFGRAGPDDIVDSGVGAGGSAAVLSTPEVKVEIITFNTGLDQDMVGSIVHKPVIRP